MENDILNLEKAISEINALLVTENIMNTPSRESLLLAVRALNEKLRERVNHEFN